MRRHVFESLRRLLACAAIFAPFSVFAAGDGGQQNLTQQDVQAAEMQLTPEEVRLIREMALKQLIRDKAPLDEHDIDMLKNKELAMQAEIYRGPTPIIRSVSAKLSLDPGSRPGKVLTVPGYVTAITFLDVTGEPWPITMVSRSKAPLFSVQHPDVKPGNILTVSALKDEANTLVNVFLQGEDRPVSLYLSSKIEDDPAGKANLKKHKGARTKTRRVHYGQVTFTVLKRGPLAKPLVLGKPIGTTVGDEMQGFMDNVPPKDAVEIAWVRPVPGAPKAWRWNGHVYVRTNTPVLLPAYLEVARQRDWYVFKLPETDNIVVEGENGRPLTLIAEE